MVAHPGDFRGLSDLLLINAQTDRLAELRTVAAKGCLDPADRCAAHESQGSANHLYHAPVKDLEAKAAAAAVAVADATAVGRGVQEIVGESQNRPG